MAGNVRLATQGVTVTTEVPRGYARGRATRQEIIERALGVFGESGYRGASLRELASRCGISHPGLIYHFPTKAALLLAVLEQRDAVDDAWLSPQTTTGAGTLSRLIGLVALNASRRGIVELFVVLSAEATAAEHPAHAYFAQRYKNAVSSATRAYVELQARSELREDIDPDVAGPQLVALMDGLQVQWLHDGGATDMAGIIGAHVAAQLTVPLGRGGAGSERSLA